MKAYELLAEPTAWTQGSYARNKAGKEVDSHSPEACAWCMAGAIEKCYPNDTELVLIYSRILDEISPLNVAKFNDSRTHAEVLAILKRAEDVSN